MERMLLADAGASQNDTAPFFGFIGAAAALVFSCELPPCPSFTFDQLTSPRAVCPKKPAGAFASDRYD